MKIVVVVALTVLSFAQNPSEKPDRKASNSQKETCNTSNPPIVVNCNESTRAIADHDSKEAPERDAPVQWSNWALVAVAAITGFVIWLQTVETGKAAEAARISADAAQKNIDLIIRKERAWLIFDIKNPPHLTVGSKLFITFTIQHDGATSARNVKSQTNAVVSDSYESPQNEIIPLHIDLPTVVPPSYGTKMFSRPLIQFGNAWGLTTDEEMRNKIAAKQMFIHFWGFIKYTDLFDRPRETTFRYRLITGLDEESIEYWEPYGKPEDNHQT